MINIRSSVDNSLEDKSPLKIQYKSKLMKEICFQRQGENNFSINILKFVENKFPLNFSHSLPNPGCLQNKNKNERPIYSPGVMVDYIQNKYSQLLRS